MTSSQRRAPPEPDWPSHHSDAPAAPDPRSWPRGVVAGGSVVLIALALASVGPWTGQSRVLIVLLGWIAAVGVGGWAYRGRSRGAGSGTRLLAGLAVVALIGSGGLFLISLQVRELLTGTVVFGASGAGCEISHEASVFALSAPVRGVAYLRREVAPSETVRVVLVGGGLSTPIANEASPRSFDCLGATLTPAVAGEYRMEVRSGGELLASGSFRVRADPRGAPYTRYTP